MNFADFGKKFKNEQSCINFLIKERWGSKKNICCPRCDHKEVYIYKNNKTFKCKGCLKQFSIRIGTIFEGSNMPLYKWFFAIYLFTSFKKGVSSVQLAKTLGTTQKTAWFMLGRIRVAMAGEGKKVFEGITEIDEAYFGGAEKNRHMRDRITKPRTKTVIVGLVNRDTKEVVAKKVESAKTHDLQPTIYETIKEGSTIITDESKSYNVLKWNYTHETVNHSKYEYVRKEARVAYKIHTNTIEGFWSIVKRGINGIYHWVSKKHIDLYLQEYTFRYNKRALTDYARFESFFKNVNKQRLSYKALTA